MSGRSSWSRASATRNRVGELRRDPGVELVDRGRRLALLLERELRQRAGLVGQAARHELIGHDAERVQIGARPSLLAAGLLGREVGGRPEHRADLGDARLVGGAGDPEVGELDHIRIGHEQVARLDVPVHDAVAVRVVESAAGLGHHVDRLLDFHRAVVAEQLGAGVAGDVLHHDEVLARSFVEAEIEHLHDVRVDQPGGRQCLATEAGHERRVVREMLGEQLDRYVALQALVERQLHRGHPADAEAALDPVPPDDRCSVSHPPPPFPPLLPSAGPVPPLLPLPVVVVVPPPSPAPPVVVVVREVPGFVGVVAVVLVVVVGVVLVVVVVVGVVVAVVVVGVVVEVVVGGDVVVVAWCWRQSFAASCAIVTAPWLRLLRSVGLTVTGRLLNVLVESRAGVDRGAAVAGLNRGVDLVSLAAQRDRLVTREQAGAAAAGGDERDGEAEPAGEDGARRVAHARPDFRGSPRWHSVRRPGPSATDAGLEVSYWP